MRGGVWLEQTIPEQQTQSLDLVFDDEKRFGKDVFRPDFDRLAARREREEGNQSLWRDVSADETATMGKAMKKDGTEPGSRRRVVLFSEDPKHFPASLEEDDKAPPLAAEEDIPYGGRQLHLHRFPDRILAGNPSLLVASADSAHPANTDGSGAKVTKFASRYTALQLFDLAVARLTERGIFVIINNHMSSAGWCCKPWDGNRLWKTGTYTQETWMRSWEILAERYKSNPLVIGFDLRNEIGKSGPEERGDKTQAMEHLARKLNVPYRDATWFENKPEKDWAPVALLASRAALAQKPGALIFIPGLVYFFLDFFYVESCNSCL